MALDSAVAQALADREQGGVRAAMEAFWTAWAEATWANIAGKLRHLSDKSATALGNLRDVDAPTEIMQAATDAFTASQTSLQAVFQICQQPNAEALELLRAAMGKVQAAAPAAKMVLEALKAEQKSNQQSSEGG